MFFFQFIVGLIVYYKEMLLQFVKGYVLIIVKNMGIGLFIFVMGLFKKVVIVDGIVGYVNIVFVIVDIGGMLDFFVVWVGVLVYIFQLYFDFLGYFDMVIGLVCMFGIVFLFNFYLFYKVVNIFEFW